VHGAAARCSLIDRPPGVGIECRAVALQDEEGFADGLILSAVMCRAAAVEIALQNTSETLLANADALFEEKERAQVT